MLNLLRSVRGLCSGRALGAFQKCNLVTSSETLGPQPGGYLSTGAAISTGLPFEDESRFLVTGASGMMSFFELTQYTRKEKTYVLSKQDWFRRYVLNLTCHYVYRSNRCWAYSSATEMVDIQSHDYNYFSPKHASCKKTVGGVSSFRLFYLTVQNTIHYQ